MKGLGNISSQLCMQKCLWLVAGAMRPITIVLQNMKDFVGSCDVAIPLMIWICLFCDRRSDYLHFQFRFRNVNGYHGSWYGDRCA